MLKDLIYVVQILTGTSDVFLQEIRFRDFITMYLMHDQSIFAISSI